MSLESFTLYDQMIALKRIYINVEVNDFRVVKSFTTTLMYFLLIH